MEKFGYYANINLQGGIFIKKLLILLSLSFYCVIYTGCNNTKLNELDIGGMNNSKNTENNSTNDINSSKNMEVNELDSNSITPFTTDTSTKEIIVQEDLSRYFESYDGCFVMFDRNNNQYTIYNKEKSNKRLSPCSTFKIVNSLIILETGVLENENTVIKWDGREYQMESWNGDQTLQSAITNSVVWVYQNLAAQVGEKNMQEYLNLVNYGNNDISGGITKFWLQSTLTISPLEQVNVLRRLYIDELPFSKQSMDIVKKVLVLSFDNDIKLSGKTGSGNNINGWFVGYVENKNNVYFFATNIESKENESVKADGPTAKGITLEILKDKGIY